MFHREKSYLRYPWGIIPNNIHNNITTTNKNNKKESNVSIDPRLPLYLYDLYLAKEDI